MQIPDSVKALFAPYPQYVFAPRQKGTFDPDHEYAYEIDYADGVWPISNPLDIELACYRDNWNNSAFEHLRNAHHMLWPQDIITWHDWTERRFQAHCENHKFIVWASGANAGKSVDAGKLMILFYISDPNCNTGLCGSTTLAASESRMWGYLKKYYAEEASMEMPGKLFLSNPAKICLRKTDTIHGVFSVPLIKSNNSGGSSRDLIGRHPKKRLFVIIDEGPDVPPGFMDAESNWEKSQWFQCTVLGNSAKMTDPHGILGKPIAGWDKVNPDIDIEWITQKGICLYFDCYRSPAITEKNPIKKAALSKFLFTEESIQKSIRDHGENSPEFWRMTRGFWPPESVGKNVLSMLDMDKHHARDKAEWAGTSDTIDLVSLDPSFTFSGDACILRHAKLGTDVSGRLILDFQGEEGVHKLRFNVRDEDPIEYQMVKQVREFCVKRKIDPFNFTLDVTGTGTGMGSIVEKEWSKKILKTDSTGECSEQFIDQEQTTTAREKYDRRATELVFALQRYVRSDQIRGLDDLAIDQVCTREYSFKGKKISIEKKEDYKMRLGRVDKKYKSPDEMDAVCLLIELAWRRFNFQIDHGRMRAEKSGLRKFFDSKYKLGDGPEDGIQGSKFNEDEYNSQRSAIGSHPAAWGDSFMHEDNYEEQE